MQQRMLDPGNPTRQSISTDFARLGFDICADAGALDPRTPGRLRLLEELNSWRNAVAHQDWRNASGSSIKLHDVRRWRSACSALALTFDRAVAAHLVTMVGTAPW